MSYLPTETICPATSNLRTDSTATVTDTGDTITDDDVTTETIGCYTPTYGGNSNGAYCMFPFLLLGQLYTTCMFTGRDNLWCATTSSYDQDSLWGYCNGKISRLKIWAPFNSFLMKWNSHLYATSHFLNRNPVPLSVRSLILVCLKHGHLCMWGPLFKHFCRYTGLVLGSPCYNYGHEIFWKAVLGFFFMHGSIYLMMLVCNDEAVASQRS